jgi:hypothetical protein
MFGWTKIAEYSLGIFNKVLESVGWVQKRSDENRQRETGAQGQQLADHKETLKAKNDQLEKAVNRRPGDARKRLRDGSF